MRKFIVSGLITATIIVAAGVIFNACKKDNVSDTSKTQLENQDGYFVGDIWGAGEVLGTYVVDNAMNIGVNFGNGFEPVNWGNTLCTRAVYEKRWVEDRTCHCRKIDYVWVRTDIVDCGTLMPIRTVNYRIGLHPDIPADSYPDIDYSDITNFVFYVNNQLITPTADGGYSDEFEYETEYETEVETADGTTFTRTGIARIQVNHEHVVNLWLSLQELGVFNK